VKSKIPRPSGLSTAKNISFDIGNIRYEWHGNLGSLLTSYEKYVKLGEIRMIAGVALVCCRLETRVLKIPRVSWCGINTSSEFIRDFKQYLL